MQQANFRLHGRRLSRLRTRTLGWMPLMAFVTGCASVMPASTEAYRCAGGAGFTVAFVSDASARLEIGGMDFSLQREPVAGEGSAYACSMLSLWRDGKTARLKMDGADAATACYRLP